ncbi:MAG: DsbA family protein [bacterium]|nr:MAG: DsbA family protein [bacterium]
MPLLEQVLEKYPRDVRIVELNFPLNNHKMARPAAAAALAAWKQGKFWEFHDRLFQDYDRITESLIDGIAGELSLDPARFQRDRNSQAINDLINRDLRQGQQLGVRGTPTIFVNGRRLSNRSLTGFSQMIDQELAKGK